MPVQTIHLNQGLAKFETFFMNDNSESLITNHFLHGENRSIHESIESFLVSNESTNGKTNLRTAIFQYLVTMASVACTSEAKKCSLNVNMMARNSEIRIKNYFLRLLHKTFFFFPTIFFLNSCFCTLSLSSWTCVNSFLLTFCFIMKV